MAKCTAWYRPAPAGGQGGVRPMEQVDTGTGSRKPVVEWQN
jgi:hypothetical protein